MPRPGLGRRERMAVLDHPCRLRGDVVELRDVFDILAIRHGADQADMQFHQEMRADRHVEGLGRMRDLQPGRDAADAADIDLHDASRRPAACIRGNGRME